MQKSISPLKMPRQEVVLLGLRAELQQRRPHRVGRQHRHGRAGPHRLVVEDELLHRRHPAAAVLLGPADPEPAVGSHLADDPAPRRPETLAVCEVLDHLRRQELGVVAPRSSSRSACCGSVRARCMGLPAVPFAVCVHVLQHFGLVNAELLVPVLHGERRRPGFVRRGCAT